MDIARGRQDHVLFDRYAELHDQIVAAYPEGMEYRHWKDYASPDPGPLKQAVETFQLGQMFRLDRLERGLTRALDQDIALPVATLTAIRDYAREHEFLVLEAEAERGLGRQERRVDLLQRARSLFERAGATPYVARVRSEAAMLSGDEAEMAAGLRVLEQLGDAEQLGRFERLQVG
jgi:hypothetical protein